MKSVPAGRIRPAPRAASAAAAALLQASLESSDLKRAVDCSVRASPRRAQGRAGCSEAGIAVHLGSFTSGSDSVPGLGEYIVIQTAGGDGKEGQAARHLRKEAALQER